MTEPYRKIKLFNPLPRDFTVQYDIHGDGEPVVYVFHAQEIESFDEPVAEHIKNHLANEIAYNTRGNGTFEAAKEKAIKRIEV